jgi:hypothetical protein
MDCRWLIFGIILGLASGCTKSQGPTPTAATSTATATTPTTPSVVAPAPTRQENRVAGTGMGRIEPIPPYPTGSTKLDSEGKPLPPYAIARLDRPHRKSKDDWKLTDLSVDGTKLVSIELDWVSILDPFTFKPLSKPVHVPDVVNLTYARRSFSNDCSRFAAMTINSLIVVETATGNVLLRLSQQPASYSWLRISEEGKLVSFSQPSESADQSAPRTCIVWDIDSGKEIHRFQDSVWVVFSPDQKLAYTSNGQLWDLATKTVRYKLENVEKTVALFSPDSKLLTLRDYKFWNIRVVDVATGHDKYTYGVARFSPESGDSRNPQISFSPDSKTLRLDGTTSISWNMTTGESLGEKRTLVPLPKDYRQLGQAFVGDKVITVAADEHVLYSWDAVNGKILSPPLAGHNSKLIGVAFTKDGQEVVTESVQEICRWNPTTGEAIGRHTDKRIPMMDEVAVSSDGTRVILDSRVIDLKTNQPIGKPFPRSLFENHKVMPQFLTPDGKLIAFLGSRYDRATRLARNWVFEVETGKPILDFTLTNPLLTPRIQATPDGSKIIVYQALKKDEGEGMIEMYDAKTGAFLNRQKGPELGNISKFKMLDHCRAIVSKYTLRSGLTTPDQGELEIVNLETGQIEKTLEKAQSREYTAIALSSDRKRVATLTRGSGHRLLEIFDLESGKVVMRQPMHSVTVKSYYSIVGESSYRDLLAFSPNGKRLAMVETDFTALVLELPDEK